MRVASGIASPDSAAAIFAAATSLASGSLAVSTAREASNSAAAAVDTSAFTPTTAFIAAAGHAIASSLGPRASSVDVVPCNAGVSVPQRAHEAFSGLRWAVDFPLALGSLDIEQH